MIVKPIAEGWSTFQTGRKEMGLELMVPVESLENGIDMLALIGRTRMTRR